MQVTSPSHQGSDDAGFTGATAAAIIYATSVAIIMLNVAPAAEPLLRQVVHLSSVDVGAVFSFELAAMGLASIPAYLWLGKVDASRVARCAYAVFILGNVLSSMHLSSFALYAAARVVTGLGAGTLMVLGMSMAARARQPHRLYALITFWQLASGAVMLWLHSRLARGDRALYDLFHVSAALGVLGFVAAGPLLRPGHPASPEVRTRSPARSTTWTTTLLAIAFAMVFNLVVGGLWAFAAEYAGANAEPVRVALVLAWATAAGLAGAASAFLIGASWTPRRMLIAGYVGVLLGAGLLQFARTPIGFAAGCCVLSLAWNFCVPFVFATVARRDATGRLMSAANLAFAFGLALGPLLAGEVIGALGLDALFPCAMVGVVLGIVLTQRISRPASA